jgi:heat shock protein HslJ
MKTKAPTNTSAHALARNATALMALCGLSACAGLDIGPPPTPIGTPPTAQSLAGSSWLLEDLSGRGVIDRIPVTLSFTEPGRVSGNASCNRYLSTAQVTAEGRLSVARGTSIATTRMMCTPVQMQQEQRYLEALDAAGRMYVDGQNLYIHTSAHRLPLKFVRNR